LDNVRARDYSARITRSAQVDRVGGLALTIAWRSDDAEACMKSFVVSTALLCTVLACGEGPREELVPAHEALSRASGAPWYEVYRAGDPTTDQLAGAPGSKSYLVGTLAAGADVPDDDFRESVAKPVIQAGADFYAVLNQCYSGGFLDDLAPLGGNQFVLTAARHTELASYGYVPPSGVDIDSTDAFLRALGDGHQPAERVAAAAVALNPFGPNPNAQRVSEAMGSEHAQYYASGRGAELRPADHASRGLAVLWAGQPATRDGTQMAAMVDRLVGMGFTRDRIWFLYGDGLATADHPIVSSHIEGKVPAVHLRAATRKQLAQLFGKTFAPGAASRPDFVFFYVGDHGGLDGKAFARRGFEPDPLVAPQVGRGVPLFGAGDADL
jgi:hypothetical protein